jgi:hypothetical protein
MTKLSQLCTTSLLLGTLLSGSALAHSTPYSHYHATPKKKRIKVVYRTTPAPPTRVVVVQEKTVIRPKVTIRRPTVVIERPAAPVIETTTARVITDPKRSSGAQPYLPLSIGIRALGAQTSMEDGTQGEVAMGGAGLTIRSRFADGFGLELSADVLAGEDAGFMQTSIPVFASASYHFLPGSFLQPYAVAGVGAEFSRREFLDGRYLVDSVDIGVQAGVGAELFFTDDISLTTDVRFKAMGTVKRDGIIRDDCISASGSMTGFCDGLQSAATGGDANLGVQVGLGANIYF